MKRSQKRSQKTNIIYLTTKCNLDCDYCYERERREKLEDQLDISDKEIVEFFSEIAEREKESQCSTIVLFGGEPTLVWHKVYMCMVTMMYHKNHNWSVGLVTNGVTMSKDWHKVKFLMENLPKSISFHVEISCDISGQVRRTFKNGSPSWDYVLAGMDALAVNNIPFRISYTLHKDNYDNFSKDMIYICEKYPMVDEIKVSIAHQEISEKYGDRFDAINKIKPYAIEISKRYNVIICEFVCGITCSKCDKALFDGKHLSSPTKGNMYEESCTEKQFDNF